LRKEKTFDMYVLPVALGSTLARYHLKKV
jgi:hypothetical protein